MFLVMKLQHLLMKKNLLEIMNVEFDASKLASGIYFYQLRASDHSTGSGQGFVETKKMILIK